MKLRPHPTNARLRAATAAVAATLFVFVRPASAEDSTRTRVERIISGLAAREADRTLTANIVVHARQALDRAGNARRAGDNQHGSQLEALALEFAESAADLVRTRDSEQRTTEVEQKALDAETRVIRARALVEQAAARRGRAAEHLQELESKSKQSAAPATTPAKGAAPATTKGKP